MVSKTRKRTKNSPEPQTWVMQSTKPELEDFFESVNERMKNLAIARKPYKCRNDKELSVRPGDIFEVLDDDGAWWCLRAPSGKTGHVPKYNLELIPNPVSAHSRVHDQPADPIIVKVPVIVKTSVHKEAVEERSPTPLQHSSHLHRHHQHSAPAPTPAVAPAPSPERAPTGPPTQISPPHSTDYAQPPVRPPHPIPEVRTIVKEIYRHTPVRQARHGRTPSRHGRHRRSSSVSSESDSDSSSYDNAPRKIKQRLRKSSRKQNSPARRQRLQDPTSHCCQRRSCCCRCRGSPRVHSAGPMTRSPNDEEEDKMQQPMIIILEPPKQDTPIVPEPEPVDEYYDPNQGAPIQIMLTPSGQFTPQMTVGAQYPTYGQQTIQMCTPNPVQWPCAPYYQTYA